VRTTKAIREAGRNSDPDALLSLHWRNTGIPSILATRDIPVIQDVHGSEIWEHRSRWTTSLWSQLLGRVLSSVDLVTTRTPFQREMLLSRGHDGARIEICPGGIDPGRFEGSLDEEGSTDQDLELLTVGRVVPRKGHETVLEAMAVLQEEGVDVRYRVAGSGPHQGHLRERTSELGLDETVDLLGFVPEDELSAVYRSADVFVMPNEDVEGDIEGFGLVLLEAWYHGLPVVAGNVHGPACLVRHDEDGFLVEPGDADELAEHLDRLRREPGTLATLGRNGQERVEADFTYRAIAERYKGLIAELADH
jgi:glycosyltransferase involved in cell wall biosynthesis